MTLALDQMDPTVAGIFYLVAVVLFVIAAVASVTASRLESRAGQWVGWGFLVALGLAFAFFVVMWNSFALED